MRLRQNPLDFTSPSRLMEALIIPNWLLIAETTIKILAVIFAGGWAVFLLIQLRKTAIARAQLDNLHSEREKKMLEGQKTQRQIQELDLRLKVQPVIRAKMITSTHRTSTQDGWILFATVEIANTGICC